MSATQERPQCPIGLVPFEAEGPNRPFGLACGHNISEENLRLFLNKLGRLECPVCNHPMASRNISDYKPNYGMIEILQLMEASVMLSSIPSVSPPSPTARNVDANANQEPQLESFPGSLSDWQPAVVAGASSDILAADSSELEALPRAGSQELVELWPRVMRRYWINAAEALGNRNSWEPWGVDSEGSVVYSSACLPMYPTPYLSTLIHMCKNTGFCVPQAVLAPQGMRVAVLEVKLPPFATLETSPEVQLRLLRLARYNALARLRPHCIQFMGLGQSPPRANADDSTGLAAGLSVYELPRSCLAEHMAFSPEGRLADTNTMALARMIAAALAEAENSYLAGAAPGLFSIMVCPSTQTGGQLAPDFRLAPFCRGLEWFTTWQVEDVFAKIMSGEHPNVSATRLKTPVKAVLNDCLQADPAARPSAEAVHTTLLMLLANDDTDGPVAENCSDARFAPGQEAAPQPAVVPPPVNVAPVRVSTPAPVYVSTPDKTTQNCGCVVM